MDGLAEAPDSFVVHTCAKGADAVTTDCDAAGIAVGFGDDAYALGGYAGYAEAVAVIRLPADRDTDAGPSVKLGDGIGGGNSDLTVGFDAQYLVIVGLDYDRFCVGRAEELACGDVVSVEFPGHKSLLSEAFDLGVMDWFTDCVES